MELDKRRKISFPFLNKMEKKNPEEELDCIRQKRKIQDKNKPETKKVNFAFSAL